MTHSVEWRSDPLTPPPLTPYAMGCIEHEHTHTYTHTHTHTHTHTNTPTLTRPTKTAALHLKNTLSRDCHVNTGADEQMDVNSNLASQQRQRTVSFHL